MRTLLDDAYAVACAAPAPPRPPALHAVAPPPRAAPATPTPRTPAAVHVADAPVAALLALQRRTRASTRQASRLRFSIAPLPSFKTHFIHFDNTTMSHIHWSLCKEGSQTLAGAPTCTKDPNRTPIGTQCAPAAWAAF